MLSFLYLMGFFEEESFPPSGVITPSSRTLSFDGRGSNLIEFDPSSNREGSV